jgi:AcrR family transcriptional regulator
MKKTPLAALREKEKKARQELLVDAAERVFAAKPFPKVSMRDIAAESGVSLSSIYRYFPDQETLFLAALIRGAGKIEAKINPLLDRDDVTVELIAGIFVEFLIDNDPYFRMMTHFMLDGVLNRESIQTLNRIERGLLDQFDRLFKRQNPNGNPRMLSHAFFASLNGILITYRNYPGREITDVHRHMRQLGRIIAGMFAAKAEPERMPVC